MTILVLDTQNRPRSKFVREQDPSNQKVRVYRNSPEDLILQLWNGRRYTLIALLPAEARAIAQALIEIADELQLEPLSEGELQRIVRAGGDRTRYEMTDAATATGMYDHDC